MIADIIQAVVAAFGEHFRPTERATLREAGPRSRDREPARHRRPLAHHGDHGIVGHYDGPSGTFTITE